MILSGRGGGSTSQKQQKPRKTKTANDTLGNTTFLELVDLLGEGEIQGFASAEDSGYARDSVEYNRACLKDIYFDKTPVLQPGANVESEPAEVDYNFQDIVARFRWGTQDQEIIPNVPEIQTEIGVGVIVTNETPVTRRITDTDVDAVRITLSWQQLQWFQSDGDIQGDTVDWEIQLSYNGGPFVNVYAAGINNKRSADPFQIDQTIDIDGDFPVDIRVVRNSPDSDDSNRINEFSWSSYTLRKYASLTYPNSALVYLAINAEDFNSIPTRSYRLRLRKIAIPSNATVDLAGNSKGRLVYDGVWDGTFAAAQWTNDPAWALWDLLTNSRYGFGEHISEANLDKWAFYAASQYCAELVPTGVGDSTEPRFACNVSIQTLTEAYKLINDLASVMACMPYYSAGGITISQDRPSDPVYLFNQSNVIGGRFEYSGTSLKQRHTVASVAYLNLNDQDIAYEVVEDQAAIVKYGAIVAEVTGFACTSQSQARRLGRMLLATEQLETEVCTFTTALDAGSAVRPGMVVSVSDPLKTGNRHGGRIASGTTTTVVIDVPVAELPTVTVPTVQVLLIDGTVETRPVASSAGSTLTVSPAFSVAPLAGGPFIYADSISQWRVLGVREQDRCEYVITAMTYAAAKYGIAERDVPLGSDGFDLVDGAAVTVDAPSITTLTPSIAVGSEDSENIILLVT